MTISQIRTTTKNLNLTNDLIKFNKNQKKKKKSKSASGPKFQQNITVKKSEGLQYSNIRNISTEPKLNQT